MITKDYILVFSLILLLFFICLIKKTEQKISFNSTSTASALFYSRVDNISCPRKLTIEQVRSSKGLNNISEEDAKEIIDGLYNLSITTYNIYKNGTGRL